MDLFITYATCICSPWHCFNLWSICIALLGIHKIYGLRILCITYFVYIILGNINSRIIILYIYISHLHISYIYDQPFYIIGWSFCSFTTLDNLLTPTRKANRLCIYTSIPTYIYLYVYVKSFTNFHNHRPITIRGHLKEIII